MDTSKHGAPLPQLPADLDDPAALDRWYCEWNAWMANEATTRNWPWLKPMTPAMLHEIVEREKKRRSNTDHSTPQEEYLAARDELNALDTHLRATDSQYEAKRMLLVPILQPIFKHIPRSNWRELFEQAYARTQVPVGSPTQDPQRDLAEGRDALTALENRLRVQDPAYETKKALLVPILKPIFAQIPPSKWATAFENAYVQTRVPADPTTSHEARPTEVTPISAVEKWTRALENVASVSFSIVAPYFVAAWVITKVATNLSFGVTLAGVFGARLSFTILDSIGRMLQWRLGGRTSAVNYWLRFLQHNEFPIQRRYRRDGIGNYLWRIQDDSSMNPKLRLSAKEMATRLAAFEEVGMFTGMRGRSAAEAALEIHAPSAAAPEFDSR
jgi:hypothetical protein